MSFKKVKNNYILIIISILIVSFIMNIYVSWENISYKYRVGQSSYLNTEDIRTRNNGNIDILENSIKLGSINSKELLKLYSNYNIISDSVIELTNDYNFYKGNKIVIFSKGNIDGEQVSKNEIYSRIKEFISQELNNSMKDGNYVTKIDVNLKKDFIMLLKLAKDVNGFYDMFGEKTLKGKTEKDKEKMVIKYDYWIDILEGIDSLSAEYRDYEFNTIKNRMNVNN